MIHPKPKETSLPAKCNAEELEFPGYNGRKIEGNFQGGEVSRDGGLMLLKQMERKLKLTEKLNVTLKDPRNPDMIKHRQVDMLQQRVYGIALGYEDLNNHNHLRKDLV